MLAACYVAAPNIAWPGREGTARRAKLHTEEFKRWAVDHLVSKRPSVRPVSPVGVGRRYWLILVDVAADENRG